MTVFKFVCRFEAEVDKGDLDPHQVFPTYQKTVQVGKKPIDVTQSLLGPAGL